MSVASGVSMTTASRSTIGVTPANSKRRSALFLSSDDEEEEEIVEVTKADNDADDDIVFVPAGTNKRRRIDTAHPTTLTSTESGLHSAGDQGTSGVDLSAGPSSTTPITVPTSIPFSATSSPSAVIPAANGLPEINMAWVSRNMELCVLSKNGSRICKLC
jgi:hypothetical protein